MKYKKISSAQLAIEDKEKNGKETKTVHSIKNENEKELGLRFSFLFSFRYSLSLCILRQTKGTDWGTASKNKP